MFHNSNRGTCPRRFNFEQLGTAEDGPRYDTAIDGDFGNRRFDHLINDGKYSFYMVFYSTL